MADSRASASAMCWRTADKCSAVTAGNAMGRASESSGLVMPSHDTTRLSLSRPAPWPEFARKMASVVGEGEQQRRGCARAVHPGHVRVVFAGQPCGLRARQHTQAPFIADPPFVADAEHDACSEGLVVVVVVLAEAALAATGQRGQAERGLEVKAFVRVRVPIDERPEHDQ